MTNTHCTLDADDIHRYTQLVDSADPSGRAHPLALVRAAAPLWEPRVTEIRTAHRQRPVIHLAQSALFARAVRPTEQLIGRCAVHAVHSLGEDAVYTLRVSFTEPTGARVAQFDVALLIDGQPDEPAELPPWRAHRAVAGTDTIGLRRRHFDLATAREYARVSRDANPIHRHATAAEDAGFPGPIAHGLHVLAAGLSVARELGVCPYQQLAEIRTRFGHPVVLPTDVSYRVQRTGDARTFCIAADTAAGPALKRCWFRLRE
ncbi:MaoC family dehydratase [Nocardia brasiliensis]|uniref:MaoC family dehydratase n=1 Tax=Nocardia brasiliensis TaxID=37326 RepID=UPI00366CCACC